MGAVGQSSCTRAQAIHFWGVSACSSSREDELLRKATQPFLGEEKKEHQCFSLLMACDLEHVMCACSGGLEKEGEREKFPEAISAYPPPCFWSILKDCPSHRGVALEEKEGDTFSRSLFTSALF